MKKNPPHTLSLVKKNVSTDGSVKLLLRAPDSQYMEAVLIPGEECLSACLSTQVGCKWGCTFCATGHNGFTRNISSAEIIDQLLWLQSLCPNQQIEDVVFMGMGEPLENYDHVLSAARNISSKCGFNIKPQHITISTAGVIPGILRLMEEPEQFKLAISLNSASNIIRSQLMPINKKYPLKLLFDAVKQYKNKKDNPRFFQYILIAGINDRGIDASRLSCLLKDISTELNIIPYNSSHKKETLKTPSYNTIRKFYDKLNTLGVDVSVRYSKGKDIKAACGQLNADFSSYL